MTRLYIGNVPNKTDTNELKELLSEIGKIKFFDIKEGSGYMEFETHDEAEEAIKKFNGTDFHGKAIIVEHARRPISRGSFRGGRRFNNRRPHRRSRSRSYSRSRSRNRRRRRDDRGRSSSRSRSVSRDRNHRRKSRRSRS